MKVIVTGASSGIGYAIAKVCLERKWEVVALSRRKPELAGIRHVALDLGRRSEVEAFAHRHAELVRTTDVLINNAGLAKGLKPFQDVTADEWDAMIDVNLKGLLHLTRAVLPSMIERGSGHIVQMGSIAGRWMYPRGNVYCATKAAVHAMTESLRMDTVGSGVRITEILPGMVETEFSEVRLGNPVDAKRVYEGLRPLTPADVAESVMWALDRPAHVNIQEIVLYPTDQAGFGLTHRLHNSK